MIAFALYANTLYFPFVFDDHRVVLDPSLETLAERSLHLNRSAVNVTFLINKALHGDWLPGYRLLNILIHATNAFLIFSLLNMLAKNDRCDQTPKAFSTSALFVSLIFLCHPTATQSVTYISQRFNSFATLLFLLTLVLYVNHLRTKTGRYFWLALCASLLAYLSKEFTISLIAILFCIEWLWPQTEKLNTKAKRFVPFLLISLTLPILHIWPLIKRKSFSQTDEISSIIPTWAPDNVSRLDYALTQLHAFSDVYLYNFFYPLKLNIDHDFKLITDFSSIELFLIIIYSAVVLGALVLKKYRPLTSFGIIWVFLTILPTSSIIPNTEIVADHRFYLPMIGILICIFDLLDYAKISTKKIVLLIPLLAMLFVLTIQRNNVWQSEEHLWLDAHAKSPLKSRPLVNLGGTYLDQEKHQEALDCAKRAIKIEPQSFKAHYLLGRIYEATQNHREAWGAYEFVYNLLQKTEPKPKEFYKSALGLSILLYQAKNYQNARAILLPLEKNQKELKETYRVLTYIEFADGNLDKAKQYLAKALQRKAEFPKEFLKEFGYGD